MVVKYSMLVVSAVVVFGVSSEAFSQGRLNGQKGDQIHMPTGNSPSKGPRPSADGGGRSPTGPDGSGPCGGYRIILVPGKGCTDGGSPTGGPAKQPFCPRGKKSDGTCW